MRRALIGVFLIAVLGQASAAATASSRRIVSLNLCVDQILLDLVPRERIAALSWLTADPNVSPVIDRVGGLTLVRGAAEEVLALDPDLVLAGTYTTPATVELLRRVGRRVEVVPLAADFAGIRSTVRHIATAVGEHARGEALIAEFNQRLAQVRGKVERPISAVVYQVGGVVSGPGSLIDAAIQAAGLANGAADRPLARGGRLALESLIADPPDLIVLAQAAEGYRTAAADNLRHPALHRLLRSVPSLELPMPLWLCAAPRIVEAVELLAAARGTVEAGSRRR